MDDARKVSRREYLKKREDKELLLLEKELRDEEFLFEGKLPPSRLPLKSDTRPGKRWELEKSDLTRRSGSACTCMAIYAKGWS